MTVTGAVVVALVLGPTAWLMLRGERTADLARAAEHLPPPGAPSLPGEHGPTYRPPFPAAGNGPDTAPNLRGSRRSTR